jgi:hypothetical protein
LSPLRPLPNSNDTSSQGVHFYEPITKFDLEGVSNVLTCMVGSNIGESKEYSWLQKMGLPHDVMFCLKKNESKRIMSNKQCKYALFIFLN